MSRKAVLKGMFDDKEDKYAFECDLISKVEPLRLINYNILIVLY